ncbi:MAG: tRNA dihydrouridine synthase DusB [Bacteroides sp.]|nr:tRNA dihydrouridine synthase DusB [Bacteroides sp.]
MQPRKFGTVSFRRQPLILAPMEDVTDPPFRMLCKEMGADWVYTEFISADGLIRDADKSLQKLDINEAERPVSIQIFGAHIEAMVEAAKVAASARPDFVDINFGCPVRKVASKGAGSGIMNDVPKMVEMTRRIVQAINLPVTVKTRLGYDQKSKNIVDIAERLQDCGIAALAIHGRTRCQLYGGQADWSLIGEVKNNPRMHLPIIGNGDIIHPEMALKALNDYGVDGIMVGRASIGNPWIFREISQYLDAGKIPPPPDMQERLAICRKHIEKSVEWKGEKLALFEMRRHYSHYFKGIYNFKPYRMRLVTAPSLEALYSVLDEIAATDFTADHPARDGAGNAS